jgi:hypothetical protein
MNPIIAEMERLFPGHTLTRAQVRAAERADNPADVAASLKVQARDIRKMFDHHLGKGVAADADVIARMDLSTAIGGFGNMSLGWLLQPLGVERAFELGQRASKDTVATLYRDILGRWPDAEGREHYEDQLAAGRPRWEIVREIELSDEARAK